MLYKFNYSISLYKGCERMQQVVSTSTNISINGVITYQTMDYKHALLYIGLRYRCVYAVYLYCKAVNSTQLYVQSKNVRGNVFKFRTSQGDLLQIFSRGGGSFTRSMFSGVYQFRMHDMSTRILLYSGALIHILRKRKE